MRRCESGSLEHQFEYLALELPMLLSNENNRKTFALFKSKFKSRWNKASRTYDVFIARNKGWLETNYCFHPQVNTTPSGRGRGRPEKDFEFSSERSKRLKTQVMRESTSGAVLSFAAQMNLRSEGKSEASQVIKDITTTTPTRASKYKAAYQKSVSSKSDCSMSGEDALAVLIGGKLSRHQYDVVRTSAPDRFPSYKVVQGAKKNCYPENIKATETSVEVPLQDLLNHTVHRLLQSIEEVVATHIVDSELDQLCLFTKWGFDGSSGHSSYKQAFCGTDATDSAVFITCMVPVRLTCKKKLIWQNPSPASTVYCRPIKMEFIKESTQLSLAEKTRVDNEINALTNSTVLVRNRNVAVAHKLIFAMIDGKVCNALTDTSSTQKCFLCGATSKMFNNIEDMISRRVNTETLEFGLSVLHGWIRMFECLLHIAYKLPIKKWQARGKDKDIVAKNKARIQKEFKDRCGLIVDTPKPGFGNTNDGNTARRFFKNAELSAEITKIDLVLIKKIHIIMIAVASGFEIDVDRFRSYVHETARYFTSLYPWYNMSPTMHKYLIHGPEIISCALLPIGQLSEEAQEARNKDFKRYREHNSRKCNRSKSNTDIFNLFLVSSDPVITSKRKIKKNKHENIPVEALQLLKVSFPFDSLSSGEEEEDKEIDDDTDSDF